MRIKAIIGLHSLTAAWSLVFLLALEIVAIRRDDNNDKAANDYQKSLSVSGARGAKREPTMLRQRQRNLMTKITSAETRVPLTTSNTNLAPLQIEQEPGDLNIRFNKVTFVDGPPADFMPLRHEHYPISRHVAQTLRTRSLADSIILADDHELLNHETAMHYINKCGGPPTMPNANSSHPFWDEFRDVVDMQLHRRANGDPDLIMTLPQLWEGYDIHEVAEAIRAEYPGLHQQNCLWELFQQGARMDYNIVPFRGIVDMVGIQVRLAELNTWAIGMVSPANFHLKWCTGRPRPEEVAFKIATGELTSADGVPEDLVDKIMGMGIKTPQEFTAYKAGSPRHPSWPAMHSAASSASLWLGVVMDLTPDQYCEILRVDYVVAFGRTCAGVHYYNDNIFGLNLGQEIVAEFLPDHLATRYGSDPEKVREKIARMRFDWADFDSRDCSPAVGLYTN